MVGKALIAHMSTVDPNQSADLAVPIPEITMRN
jgi:hypothetical protein